MILRFCRKCGEALQRFEISKVSGFNPASGEKEYDITEYLICPVAKEEISALNENPLTEAEMNKSRAERFFSIRQGAGTTEEHTTLELVGHVIDEEDKMELATFFKRKVAQ